MNALQGQSKKPVIVLKKIVTFLPKGFGLLRERLKEVNIFG